MRVFIDTNLWVYRLDQREPQKRQHVERWLADVVAEHEVVISTQVLIEFRSVVSRKLQPPLGPTQTHDLLEALSGFEVISTDEHLVLDADHLAITEHLSWFDALIAEAALRSSCSVLYSEDFGHGRTIQELRCHQPPPEDHPAIFWRSCLIRSRRLAASSKSSFLAASFIFPSS